jgi:hypothetical protein
MDGKYYAKNNFIIISYFSSLIIKSEQIRIRLRAHATCLEKLIKKIILGKKPLERPRR